jgi:hypothetical protein
MQDCDRHEALQFSGVRKSSAEELLPSEQSATIIGNNYRQ